MRIPLGDDVAAFNFDSIEAYFDNMTSLTIFRRPTFHEYLYSTLDPSYSAALAAAMFSFAARFVAPPTAVQRSRSPSELTSLKPSAWYYDMACKLCQELVHDLGHHPPPLCLLQALLLTTFYEIISAARGRAWRSLGACIRLAYEIQLHRVDDDSSPPTTEDQETSAEEWIIAEGRRRVWWALWELDVFMSTVNKLPCAISELHNATLLPVDDEAWFTGQIQQSSFLEVDPVRRWKDLQSSGNRSGKAWFLVMNSFARDVHSMSHPTTPLRSREDNPGNTNSVLATRMNILANCVSCFHLALPDTLSYDGFPASHDASPVVRRQRSEKHLIHVMTQLTKLYIHHHECFNKNPQSRNQTQPLTERMGWRDYMATADEVVHTVRNSHIDHIQYGHPLLANTVWIVAAVELLQKVYAESGDKRQLAQSNFDLLRLALDRHRKFWDTSPTPLMNLAALEVRLQSISPRSRGTREGEIRPEDTMPPPQSNSIEIGRLSQAVTDTSTDFNGRGDSVSRQDPEELPELVVNDPSRVGDDPDLFNGYAMDDHTLQAYIDSIFSNQCSDWDENMGFGT